MRRFSILLVPISIFMIITMYLSAVRYSRDKYCELERRRLDIKVNYAVDAAVDEVIQATTDLDLDYVDFEKVKIDPVTALDTFINMFLSSYNMSDSEENKALVKLKYLTLFVVTAYDGYYIATPETINDSGARDTIFTIKQPYTYKSPDGKIYALNMGYKDAKLYQNNTITKVEAPISKEEQKRIINSIVSDAIMQAVYKQKGGSMRSTIYIPDEMSSIASTNPIQNVSILAYVSNVDIGYGSVIESFGIGGARINHQRFVGCFIKDNTKYYDYVDKIPANINLIETFESPEIAAEHGYYYYSFE